MYALDLNPHTDLGCRRNISTYAQASEIARNEQTSDVQGWYQCPSPVVLPLQFILLIFHKQPRHKLVVWNVLQCNFCVLPEISGMAPNWSKTPHALGTSLGNNQPRYRDSRQRYSQDLFLSLLSRHIWSLAEIARSR